MALANASWDDFRSEGAIAASRSTGSLLGKLLMGASLLASAAAGLYVFHDLQMPAITLPTGMLREAPAVAATPVIAPMPVIAPVAMPPAARAATLAQLARALERTAFERNAASFLSETLTQGEAATGVDVATARQFATGPLRMTLPIEPRFSVPVPAVLPVLTPDEVAPVAVTTLPPQPPQVMPPVRVSPTVISPEPPVAGSVSTDIPFPAPPLRRAVVGEAEAPPALASIAPPTRVVPSVAMPAIGQNDGTAVYDISAATVYLPSGERLEAHSGLGYMADNPKYVDRRNVGSTPPGTYNLQGLDRLFFGVEALRMVPTKGVNTFGRDGFLTHTYLLRGRPKQSNGCVVFPNYARFLDAYKRGHVKRLVVVASLAGKSPIRVAEAGTALR